MNIIDKINKYIYEEEIDWDKVKESAINAAKTIFKEPDLDIIDNMLETVKNKNPKDTKAAIQIIINMMRSE